jgi:hypothetical protein
VASKALLVLTGLCGALAARAHEPITTKLTWTQEISRIVYKHCLSCHHQGGMAFPLTSYDDARPWAKAMREEVLERRMPPWGAVEGVGAFRDDPSLTHLEIEMIVSWVEGGAPEGDPQYLPEAPEFAASGSQKASTGAPLIVASGAPVTLRAAMTAAAITPRELTAGASMEVTASLPDGGVERLIWLRNYREEWTRTYWFREPMRLPKGTRIVVDATAGSAAAISAATTAHSSR